MMATEWVLIIGAIGTLIATLVNTGKTRAETKIILHQLQNNGGGTVKDGVDLSNVLAAKNANEIKEIWKRLDRLGDVDDDDRKRADDIHARYDRQMTDLYTIMKKHVEACCHRGGKEE